MNAKHTTVTLAIALLAVGGMAFLLQVDDAPVEGDLSPDSEEMAAATNDTDTPIMEWNVSGRLQGFNTVVSKGMWSKSCWGYDDQLCEFVAPPNATHIEARVTYQSSSLAEPLPVEFYLADGDGDRVVVTGEDGRATLTVDDGAPGSWSFDAQAPNRAGWYDVAFSATFVVR